MAFSWKKLKRKTSSWRWWAILPFVLFIAIPILPIFLLLDKYDIYKDCPKWIAAIFEWSEKGETK